MARYNPGPDDNIINDQLFSEMREKLLVEDRRLMKLIKQCLEYNKEDRCVVREGALSDYAAASNQLGRVRTMLMLFH
jgi:hypothetical protein